MSKLLSQQLLKCSVHVPEKHVAQDELIFLPSQAGFFCAWASDDSSLCFPAGWLREQKAPQKFYFLIIILTLVSPVLVTVF